MELRLHHRGTFPRSASSIAQRSHHHEPPPSQHLLSFDTKSRGFVEPVPNRDTVLSLNEMLSYQTCSIHLEMLLITSLA
jgi:hypothetical protein